MLITEIFHYSQEQNKGVVYFLNPFILHIVLEALALPEVEGMEIKCKQTEKKVSVFLSDNDALTIAIANPRTKLGK